MLVFVLAILAVLADWMYALTILTGVSALFMLPEYFTKRVTASHDNQTIELVGTFTTGIPLRCNGIRCSSRNLGNIIQNCEC